MKDPVIVAGAFGEIIELCEECGCTIIGCIDNLGESHYRGYPILGTDDDLRNLINYKHIPVIITPDKPHIRKKLYDLYKYYGFTFKTLISPRANVSYSAVIGMGTIIQAGVHVSAEVCIGDFVKLNNNANVMHECKIGNFSTVAPNAVLLGRVHIGDEVYIGANSTLLPEIDIKRGVTVGAGAVVTRNIVDENIIVKGIPAK